MARLYTFWFVLVAVLLFLLGYPLMWLSLQFKKLHPIFYKSQYLWIRTICLLTGVSVKVKRYYKPLKKQPVVYCCNHFSSFDNLSIALVLQRPFSIIAMKETEKIPLLGQFYKKIHVLIDRTNPRDRIKGLQEIGRKIDEGLDVAIAPEGGIKSLNPPQLYENFENGAFILAIKKQIPIVPFVFKSNYLILPEFPLDNFHRTPFEATVLPAISTKGMNMTDIEQLKNEVKTQMEKELSGCPSRQANLKVKSKWNMIAAFR